MQPELEGENMFNRFQQFTNQHIYRYRARKAEEKENLKRVQKAAKKDALRKVKKK
jgi:hypothetical protein